LRRHRRKPHLRWTDLSSLFAAADENPADVCCCCWTKRFVFVLVVGRLALVVRRAIRIHCLGN
jgi:hypothetical protein